MSCDSWTTLEPKTPESNKSDLRNELAAWMQRHASAGRGGNQILINYLIKRGIQAVEQEYTAHGIIFADER